MIASDCVAIVPVVPEATRFVVMLPGASAANSACITFVSWLIGPQLVSPSTRRPTSISGADSAAEIKLSHSGMPKNTYSMMTRARVASAEPIPTHFKGKSPPETASAESELNVRASVRHLRSRAVSPAAINMPVPGHITHRRISLRVSCAMMP